MILLFSRREDGHRRAYLDFFARLFDGRRVRARDLWLAPEPVFFMMVEENFALFAAVATLRSAFGRRTVGLLFRPLPALRGTGMRLALKRRVLGLLKRLPPVSTLTILPFSVEPDFARIADGWIYDPQLWDLTERERKIGTPPMASDSYLAGLHGAAGGRRIIAAVGRMDRAKGFDTFARAYSRSAELRAASLFVSCGRIKTEIADDGAALTRAGGVVVDREISDDELLEAYAAADAVWCCYAPDYDQASGVLGRAVQLGVPAIVRAGSLIERFCRLEGVPHLAIDPARFDNLPLSLAPREPDRGQALAMSMAEHSVPVLARAFGGRRADG